MKTTALIASALLVTLVGGGSAYAGDWTPGIDRREHRQAHRIHRGIHDGSLNRHEARRLRYGQYRIHQAERRAKADGHVTWRERMHIRMMQARENWRIRHDRHDWN
ncbi:MAG: hypothetical protein AB7K67_13285 [Hyphomicrobiaceae bacterium]